MTPVKFKFLTPLGDPIALQEFHVSLNKAAFNKTQDGLVHPEVIVAFTDAQGECTLELFPANQPYYVSMDLSSPAEEDNCSARLRFRLAVPNSSTLVWADDIIITDPVFSQAWDAESIEAINAAVTAAAGSASAAHTSELNAAGSASAAATSAATATASKDAAHTSELNAKASENQAKIYQDAAGGSSIDAQAAATAANASKVAAAASQVAAKTSQDAAKASETAAKSSETAAKTSETNANNSAIAADASKTAAAGSATAANNSAVAALASKNAAGTSETNAKTSETNAAASAVSAANSASQAANKQPLNNNLTAISALNGAANQLIMFTGPGATALLPAGVFGKSLLSTSVQAEARTAMGLVPVQSSIDVTAGRLLIPGSYGMGTPIVITDANTANTLSGGIFVLQSPFSNGPDAQAYVIQSFVYDSEVTQIAYPQGRSVPYYYMRQYRGAWQSWVKYSSAGFNGDNPPNFTGNIDDVTAIPFGFVTVGGGATGTKPPGKNFGFLHTIGSSANGTTSPVHQRWYDFDGSIGTKTEWIRSKYGTGAFGSWRLIFDQNTAVGTVSNPSAGPTTSSIIERGSNGNGDYIRFVDGTQICWRRMSNITTASYALASGMFGSDTISSSFPINFSATPTVTTSAEGPAGSSGTTNLMFTSNFAKPAASTFGGWRAISDSASVLAAGFVIDMFAIGRWY